LTENSKIQELKKIQKNQKLTKISKILQKKFYLALQFLFKYCKKPQKNSKTFHPFQSFPRHVTCNSVPHPMKIFTIFHFKHNINIFHPHHITHPTGAFYAVDVVILTKYSENENLFTTTRRKREEKIFLFTFSAWVCGGKISLW